MANRKDRAGDVPDPSSQKARAVAQYNDAFARKASNGQAKKYGARKVFIDGYVFDSRAEATRYEELKILLDRHEIRKLVIHPRWAFEIKGKPLVIRNKNGIGRKVTYTADFQYVYLGGFKPEIVVEDVKGMDTGESRLRRALMEACYDIKVRIIKRVARPSKRWVE